MRCGYTIPREIIRGLTVLAFKASLSAGAAKRLWRTLCGEGGRAPLPGERALRKGLTTQKRASCSIWQRVQIWRTRYSKLAQSVQEKNSPTARCRITRSSVVSCRRSQGTQRSQRTQRRFASSCPCRTSSTARLRTRWRTRWRKAFRSERSRLTCARCVPVTVVSTCMMVITCPACAQTASMSTQTDVSFMGSGAGGIPVVVATQGTTLWREVGCPPIPCHSPVC